MRVIITGGTGLIGRALVQALAHQDYEIIVLSRDPALAARLFDQLGVKHIQTVGWDAQTAQGWGSLINRESALVNLAGASPAHWRWTKAYRERILASRLHAGEALMEAMERYGPPAVLVQASAAGYYGDRGQELLTEASSPGQGFRAEVCQAWEASTARVTARRCILRTGLGTRCTRRALFHRSSALRRCWAASWAMVGNGYPGYTKRMWSKRFSSSSSIASFLAHSICVRRRRRRIRNFCAWRGIC